jgi:hypothetical protein
VQRQRFRLINALSVGIAIGIALITIIGLQADPDTLVATTADLLLELVTVVLAVAVLGGILNLFLVHTRRFVRREGGGLYSFFTLFTMAMVIIVRIIDRNNEWRGELEGEELSPVLFEVLQITLEAALAGLIFFFLVYAAYRLTRRSIAWYYLVFLFAVLIVLAGWLPLGGLGNLADLRDWLMEVPVMAGSRGLLIGIGLGTLVVGVRVLLGQERTIREP